MSLTVTKEEAVKVDPDVYLVEVTDVQSGPTTHGPSAKFTFKILDDEDWEGETVSGIAAMTLTPRTKLNRWLEGMGVPTDIGDEVDLIDCIGQRCQVKVEESKDGVHSNVTEVIALRKGTRKSEEEPEEKPRRGKKTAARKKTAAKKEAASEAEEEPEEKEDDWYGDGEEAEKKEDDWED